MMYLGIVQKCAMPFYEKEKKNSITILTLTT